jgi:uncharacterized lipoprotein YbaY
MKKALVLALAIPVLGLTGGCGHLNLDSIGDSSRVITGTVDLSTPADLPPDAVLEVRIVDPSPPPPPTPLATSASPRVSPPPAIVGDQTITNLGTAPPFPFRVDITADDSEIQHGLTIEARITYGGRLQYSNLSQFMIGPDTAGEPQHVIVDKM